MYHKLEEKGLLCVGCGACAGRCPVQAIHMEDSLYDGNRAVSDSQTCIECKKCEEVCPQLHEFTDNDDTPECYAIWADESIRKESTSGGVFTLLAEAVQKRGGIVCGAAFGEQWRVQHILVPPQGSLSVLRGSKYVQSETASVFPKIQDLLDEGVDVLFSGCPCQVAGLYSYLEKPYENLFTIDLLCAMTPAYSVFMKYLKENFGLDHIEEFRFRTKSLGWVCDIHQVKLKSGEETIRRPYNDAYQKGYHSHLFMRKVCEECRYAGLPRPGDLTIADFWYVEKLDPSWNDYKGTSLALVNNSKGRALFASASENAGRAERMSLEGLKYNRPEKLSAHPGRDRFFDLLKRYSFNQAVDYAFNDKYDVGITGIWSEPNYGSELTYYALFQVVRGMGLEPMMIERPRKVPWPPKEKAVLFKESPYMPYDICPIRDHKSEMREMNRRCDTFIVGSDQLWHHDLYGAYGGFCYLDYIHENKKKIAYATSFGREFWSGDENSRRVAAYEISRFDAVSVREKSGVQLCEDLFKIKADWVLDPVFLCGKQVFMDLAEKSDIQIADSFLGAYVLDIDKEKEKALCFAAEKLSLELSVITDAAKAPCKTSYQINVNDSASMEDWLCNFIKSQFVITDSFHGTCLAIMFNKPFIAISNELRGGTRFTSLLNLLGLSSRLVPSGKEILERPELFETVDFSLANEILNKQTQRSMEWLAAALENKKTPELTAVDLLADQLSAVEGELRWQAVGLARHEEALIYHGKTIIWMEPMVTNHAEAVQRLEPMVTNHAEAIQRLEPMASNHTEALDRIELALQMQKAQLDALSFSRSYRIGRIITYFPRKIKAVLKFISMRSRGKTD